MEPLPSDSLVPVEVVNGTVPTEPSQSCVSNPRTRNSKGVKTRKSQKEKQTFQKTDPLNRKDINCPICLSILIEPVTFPCEHSLCMECFRTHVRETSLYCPLCRYRLSVWSRIAIKRNSLINTEFWERIKHHYPVEVETRLAGNDSQSQIGEYKSSDDVLNKIDGTLVEPGEIRKEFDAILTQYQQEVETDRKKELEATHKYLQQLQETEGPPVETQVESDYELAKRLQQEEDKAQQRQRRGELRETSGFVRNSINLNQPSCSKRLSVASSFFQPSPKRICPDSEPISSNQHNSQGAIARNGSITLDSNSIDNESNQQFRPIACAPRTPPKRNPDWSFQQAVSVKTLVTKRSLMDEFVASEQNDDSHEQDEIDSDLEYTIHEENAAGPKIAVFGKYIAKNKRDATVRNEASTSGLFAEIETNRTENSDQSFVKQKHNLHFFSSTVLEKYPGLKMIYDPANSECESDSSSAVFDDDAYLLRNYKKQKEIALQEEKDRKIALRLQREWNSTTFVERDYATRHKLRKNEKRNPGDSVGSEKTDSNTKATVPKLAALKTAVSKTNVPKRPVSKTNVPNRPVSKRTVPKTYVPKPDVPKTTVSKPTVPEPEVTIPSTSFTSAVPLSTSTPVRKSLRIQETMSENLALATGTDNQCGLPLRPFIQVTRSISSSSASTEYSTSSSGSSTAAIAGSPQKEK